MSVARAFVVVVVVVGLAVVVVVVAGLPVVVVGRIVARGLLVSIIRLIVLIGAGVLTSTGLAVIAGFGSPMVSVIGTGFELAALLSWMVSTLFWWLPCSTWMSSLLLLGELLAEMLVVVVMGAGGGGGGAKGS